MFRKFGMILTELFDYQYKDKRNPEGNLKLL